MFDVFVLGAGFSTASGAPKASAILTEMFDSPANRELAQAVRDILFPRNPDWLHKASFNEVLSRFDLIRYFRPYPNVDYQKVEKVERALIQELVSMLAPDKTAGNKFLYHFFAAQTATSRFISFNYDLVLETALSSNGYPYCYEIGGNIESDNNSGVHPVKLLKLHGSINLVYCLTCRKIHRVCPESENKVCPHCSQQGLEPFLVAPTLYKSYELPAIRDIWFSALKTLLHSRSLCFIGYSLPDGDLLAYQMLDFAFRLADEKPVVHLVNGPHFNPAKFRNIYGERLVNTGLFFEEWVAQSVCL